MLRALGRVSNPLLEVVVVPMIFLSPSSCSIRALRSCGRGLETLERGDAFEAGSVKVDVTVRGLDVAMIYETDLVRGHGMRRFIIATKAYGSR